LDKEIHTTLPDLEIEYNRLLLSLNRVSESEKRNNPLKYGRVDDNTDIYIISFANIEASTDFSNEKISLRYPLTEQQVEIFVSYSYIEPQKTSGDIPGAIIIILLTVAASWGFSFFSGNMKPVISIVCVLVFFVYWIFLGR